MRARNWVFLFLLVLATFTLYACTSGPDGTVGHGSTGGSNFPFNDTGGGADGGGTDGGGTDGGGTDGGGTDGGGTDGGGTDGGGADGGTTGDPTGARVQIDLDLAPRQVPSNVDSIRLIGQDSTGAEVYSDDQPKSARVVFEDVPESAEILIVQFLRANEVAATYTVFAELAAGQTFVITDPDFFNDVDGSNALVAGTYRLVGADTDSWNPGVFTGSLTLDGNGNVTAGTFVQSLAGANAGVYNTRTITVTGGTYTVAANRDFDATLTTDTIPQVTLVGRVGLQPAGDSIYVSIYGAETTGQAPTYLVGMARAQRAGSGLTNAFLNGAYQVSGAGVIGSGFAPIPQQGPALGELNFDGAGNMTGTVGPNTITGAYTLSPEGVLTGQFTVPGTGTFDLNGDVAADGSVMMNATLTPAVSFAQQFSLFASRVPAETGGNSDLPNDSRFVGVRPGDGGVFGDLSITNVDLLGGVITRLLMTKYFPDAFQPLFPFPLVVQEQNPAVGGLVQAEADGSVTGNLVGVDVQGAFFSENKTLVHGVLDDSDNPGTRFPKAWVILVR